MTLAHRTRPLIDGSGKINVLDVLNQVIDHRLVIEHVPRLVNGVELRMRLGTAGHEQGAAIGRRLAGDFVRSDLLGALDDLLLIGS